MSPEAEPQPSEAEAMAIVPKVAWQDSNTSDEKVSCGLAANPSVNLAATAVNPCTRLSEPQSRWERGRWTSSVFGRKLALLLP